MENLLKLSRLIGSSGEHIFEAEAQACKGRVRLVIFNRISGREIHSSFEDEFNIGLYKECFYIYRNLNNIEDIELEHLGKLEKFVKEIQYE